MKGTRLKVLVIALLSIVMISACAKKKRKSDDVSKTKMFFHNLTSKYNGYFNADELMFFSEIELANMHSDNYNQILDVYDYVDIDNPKTVAADLDKAIEKVGTVASIHRPSHWLDDCYVLMGKAQYMKHDYESAEETFEYFQEEFDPKNPFGSNFHKKKKTRKQREKERRKKKKESEKIAKEKKKEKLKERKAKKKKRKKKKGRRSKRLTKKEKAEKAAKEKAEREQKKIEEELALKKEEEKEKEKKKDKSAKPKFYEHKPVYNEGLVWLAKTYIARERYSTANSILRKVARSEYYKPDHIEKEIAITTADLYLKQKKYKTAIPFLKAAVGLAKKKKQEARYAYVLAQVYDKLENYGEAKYYYHKVAKLHPSYEMEFNANLNMYKTDLLSGSKSRAQVIAKLEKMLKEEKNKDYRDQLFFTLGKLELKKPDIPSAISYFKQSIQANTINQIQKAESYYILAELFFDQEDYYNASMYYDSTRSTMIKNDDRFYKVNKLATNLKEIAQNIDVVNLQDSLLSIASLSKEELYTYAEDIIVQQRLLKEKMKESSNTNTPEELKNVVSSNSFGSLPSTFFAYHPQQVIAGIASFEDKWGDRELADNWRRSSDSGSNSEEEEESETASDGKISDAEIQRALKNIPQTIGAKTRAKDKIEEALFKLGGLYRERLDNCTKSTSALQRLLNEYPKTKHRAEACYLLYVCNVNSNPALATQYANIVKSDYPDSKYAKFLTDPNYLKDYMSAAAQVGRYYDETYYLFKNDNFQATIDKIAMVDSLFGKKNEYRPKFALLDAMAQGHTKDKTAYVKALKNIVSKYPNTVEKTRAKEILRFLKGDKYAFNEGLSSEGIEKFQLQDNRMHYIIVMVSSGKENVKTDDMKISISNFNKKYFKLDKLKTKDTYLDIQSRTSLLLIRRFSNREKAMVYYDTVEKNKKDFLPEGLGYETFAITQRNYREVLKQKTTDMYSQFFKENYLSK